MKKTQPTLPFYNPPQEQKIRRRCSVRLTIVTTLWYICSMVTLIVKHAARALTVLLTGVALMGMTTAKAGVDNCDPGCAMHQPTHKQAACCDVDESNHLGMVSSSDQSESQLPCCDTNLCADSSFMSREAAFTASTLDSADPGSQEIRYSQASSDPAYKKPISRNCFSQKTVPVYVITCVYLI